MSDWYPSSGVSYAQHLQQKSYFDDVTRGQKEATRASIEAMGERTRDLLGGMARSSEMLAGEMAGVQGSIDELNSSFRWGMGQVLGSLGGMADSLNALIQIAKTPAQTAAYEQFEIARDAFRQQLYEECLEALDKAIGGDHTSPGYKLEWRFHHLVGVVRLGGLPGHDMGLVDPAAAEQSFLLAARYARVDHKRDAARALLAAGWAAFVQEKLPEALGHTEGALALNAGLGEALFQAAKVQMALDRPGDGLPVLRRAIDLDPGYVVKAGGDGAFVRHGGELEAFLEALRAEKQRGLQPVAQDALERHAEVIETMADVADHASTRLLRAVAGGDRSLGLLDLLGLESTLGARVAELARLEQEARASLSIRWRTETREEEAEESYEVEEPCEVEESYKVEESYTEEVVVRAAGWFRKEQRETVTKTRIVPKTRKVPGVRKVTRSRRVMRPHERRVGVLVDGLGKVLAELSQETAVALEGCAQHLVTVPVPAGTFTMGSPTSEDGRFSNETAHEVSLTRALVMMAYPVTQGLWQGLMGNNPSEFKGDDRPVEKVSWYDAVVFANALSAATGLSPAYELSGPSGKAGTSGFEVQVRWKGPDAPGWRLPTEAEWEHACRAGTTGARYGELDEVAWYNSSSGSHPVGQKTPNAWGLFDMLGNVWEWCWDWKADYAGGPVTDPTGPESGSNRVDRGGSWNDGARLARAAYRYLDSPGYRDGSLGFRLCRSVPPGRSRTLGS